MTEELDRLRASPRSRGRPSKPCADCGGVAEVQLQVIVREKNHNGSLLHSKSRVMCAPCAVKRSEWTFGGVE